MIIIIMLNFMFLFFRDLMIRGMHHGLWLLCSFKVLRPVLICKMVKRLKWGQERCVYILIADSGFSFCCTLEKTRLRTFSEYFEPNFSFSRKPEHMRSCLLFKAHKYVRAPSQLCHKLRLFEPLCEICMGQFYLVVHNWLHIHVIFLR